MATNAEKFDSCSWGNCALAIFYGQKFPERHNEVERLKNVIFELAQTVKRY